MSSNHAVADAVPVPQDPVLVRSPSGSTPPFPIATLPPELLVQVYLWYQHDRYLCYKPFGWIRLTHVSRYWRDVALNTPLLWRDITIHFRGWPDANQRQREFLPEMLRRSCQTPLRLQLYSIAPDDAALIEPIVANLHHTEDLSILFNCHTALDVPHDACDAPILRTLKLDSCGPDSDVVKAEIPLVSPKYPLNHLESIFFSRYRYSDVSPFFRPTMKHLSLDVCSGGCAVDFLHALHDMPLLESLSLKDTFMDSPTSTAFPPELPAVKLCFLRCLDMLRNDPLSCAQILDYISFPASTLLKIRSPCSNTPHLDSKASVRKLSHAIALKAAGHGLLGDAMPVHALYVRTEQYASDHMPTILMWTDEPSFRAANAGRDPLSIFTPDGKPSYHYAPHTSACNSLRSLCLAAPDHLRTVRILIMSDYVKFYSQDTYVPERFWSASLRCLVGLKELYLESTVWDGLGLLPQPSNGISAELPFPRLRVLSLRRICFRHAPPTDEDYIYSLLEILKARWEVGLRLSVLIIRRACNFTLEDAAILQAYVDEIKWDGRIRKI